MSSILSLLCVLAFADQPAVRVGTKAFTEGYLLGELAAQVIERDLKRAVTRTFGLGTTGVTLQALQSGEIDFYPEYTGTLAEAAVHDPSLRDPKLLAAALSERGLVLSKPLGFENTYALAVRGEVARRLKLRAVSDLLGHEADLRFAFSHEFVSREDGVQSLRTTYGLKFDQNLQSIDHALAYGAIVADQADVIAAYSTDDKLRSSDLVRLIDDRHAFPPYQAVFVARTDFAAREPRVWAALDALGGSLDEGTVQRLNGLIDRDHEDVGDVVSRHLHRRPSATAGATSGLGFEIKRRTLEHLRLVGLAFLVSVLAGVPLGIWSARRPRLGQAVLIVSAVVQTIPSLALLALLIPLFGIGTPPALVALCLYSLLPVVLNTFVGLTAIDPHILETARALGLNTRQILTKIELPLAMPTILAGLRTATIIGIGTATLAALIGAGGYGAPIVSGLATNNVGLILSGAVPCAGLALIVYAGFEIGARWLRPGT